MNELERLFNDKERSLLTYALVCAIDETKKSLECYQVGGFDDLADEEREHLSSLKSLYRRFFPHLSDDDFLSLEVGR